MADDRPPAPGGLQFEHAEFSAPPGLRCVACKAPIAETYFEANGQVICEPCRDRAMAVRELGSGVGRLAGAAVLGLGAAALGAVVWYVVREVTHLEIGLIAIVVGIAVGTAVRRGAKGRGGVAYQMLAVVLTYLSIVSANAPYVWNGVRRGFANEVAHRMSTQAASPTAVSPDSDSVRAKVDELVAHLPPQTWLRIGWVVLESPFLAGFQNVIGWLIILFGLQQAWRLTRAIPFRVTGPFSLAGRAAPA